MNPYVPQSLPLTGLDYARLIRKIGPANAALARYDGLLQSVTNPGVMLSPLTNREAVLSSRIEGTQATVDEVLEYEFATDQWSTTRHLGLPRPAQLCGWTSSALSDLVTHS